MLNAFHRVYDEIHGILNDNYMKYLIGIDKYILDVLWFFFESF